MIPRTKPYHGWGPLTPLQRHIDALVMQHALPREERLNAKNATNELINHAAHGNVNDVHDWYPGHSWIDSYYGQVGSAFHRCQFPYIVIDMRTRSEADEEWAIDNIAKAIAKTPYYMHTVLIRLHGDDEYYTGPELMEAFRLYENQFQRYEKPLEAFRMAEATESLRLRLKRLVKRGLFKACAFCADKDNRVLTYVAERGLLPWLASYYKN